jgi:DNA-binding IclR family transcriptional regulator
MDAIVRHGVPVLERTLDLLGLLEQAPEGMSIRALCAALGLPRSTVYRILNTLAARKIVRRSDDGVFTLGPRLVALAARAQPDRQPLDLHALALPLLTALRDETGEPVKLSVRDGDRAKVVVAVLGREQMAPAPALNTSYPLHAGAASKVIMAHMSAADLDAHLSLPLPRYTRETITDPALLRADLQRIRRQNFALDQGEHHLTVHAIAVPVFDSGGRFVGAISVPFRADRDAAYREDLKARLSRTAAALNTKLPR